MWWRCIRVGTADIRSALKDLVLDPAQQDRVLEMKAKLEAWQREMGDPLGR